MLSCKEVTTLHATDGVHTAPLVKKLGYRVHLLMCRHCSRYVREMTRIGAAVRALYAEAAAPGSTEALLDRVLKSLERKPST